MIFAFAGKKYAGKSYHAEDVSRRTSDYVLMSFASLLRDECLSYVYDVNTFNKAKDEFIDLDNYTCGGQSIVIAYNLTTNREFMIHIANHNKHICESWYAEHLVDKIKHSSAQTIIIDDLRFPYEYDALKTLGRQIHVFFIGSVKSDEDCDESEDIGRLFQYITSKDDGTRSRILFSSTEQFDE